ncbi:threonine/homoserine efflux transporter RhtA [Leucobacter luti]|uniref:Threonine/homoserine efflux transporter RhtA n=1 Tax=Leucobacter luti TaxID=340320 RepID=A0A4R6RWY4_9MICO|nr:EamA family transporter [Leucobacter luti]TDP91569.1 threonine/homoserine efflux transporter RhtA [Leucobacter luti]
MHSADTAKRGFGAGAWHLVLGARYLVLGTWHLALGTWHSVLGTRYSVLGAHIDHIEREDSLVQRSSFTGLGLVVLSAFLFAVSGPVAKALYGIGWTPGSVILIRLVGSALLLLPFCLVALRGRWGEVRRHWRVIVLYGAISMAGVQAFFFLAVEHVTVAIAILLEMMGAPILIVLWLWGRTRRRPPAITFAGIGVSLIGVVCVLDFQGATLSWFGIAMASAAALCFAGYFLLSSTESIPISPIAFTGLGMAVGAIAAVIVTSARIMPAEFTFSELQFAGATVHWWVPAALLVVFTVLAYVCGIVGLRHIGPTVGSFANLTEVLFSALAAWIILAEALSPLQLVGGAVIIGGIVLVKWGEFRAARIAASRSPELQVVHSNSIKVDLEMNQLSGQASGHDDIPFAQHTPTAHDGTRTPLP